MNVRRTAAVVYAATSAAIVVFQLALAAGAPWGSYAMGGAFPGRFPTPLRLAAAIQAAVIAGLAAIVLARAGLLSPAWARPLSPFVWAVVAVAAISLALNVMTPSVQERTIWAPVAAVLLVCSIIVARAGAQSGRAD